MTFQNSLSLFFKERIIIWLWCELNKRIWFYSLMIFSLKSAHTWRNFPERISSQKKLVVIISIIIMKIEFFCLEFHKPNNQTKRNVQFEWKTILKFQFFWMKKILKWRNSVENMLSSFLVSQFAPHSLFKETFGTFYSGMILEQQYCLFLFFLVCCCCHWIQEEMIFYLVTKICFRVCVCQCVFIVLWWWWWKINITFEKFLNSVLKEFSSSFVNHH